MSAERVWNILAIALAMAGVACLIWNNPSAAFVLGALGAVAWFLSFRARLKKQLAAAEPPEPAGELDEE